MSRTETKNLRFAVTFIKSCFMCNNCLAFRTSFIMERNPVFASQLLFFSGKFHAYMENPIREQLLAGSLISSEINTVYLWWSNTMRFSVERFSTFSAKTIR